MSIIIGVFVSQMNGTPENRVLTPQKPVNLLPEVPSHTSRKLSDREQHDCDVIGKLLLFSIHPSFMPNDQLPYRLLMQGAFNSFFWLVAGQASPSHY